MMIIISTISIFTHSTEPFKWEKTTVALSKCHNTKDKTNFLCSFGRGNFHETRRVVKLFVCTAKSIEIRKWEPALKPYENHRDKGL